MKKAKHLSKTSKTGRKSDLGRGKSSNNWQKHEAAACNILFLDIVVCGYVGLFTL